MAIGDAYFTVTDYLAAKNLAKVSDPDALNELAIGISRLIDNELGRKAGFQKDATATVRIYMPKGKSNRPIPYDWAESENPWLYGGLIRILDVDDIASTSGLTIELDTANDGTYATALASTDYELLPRNADKGPEAKPWRQILMDERGSYGAWTPGQRVKVTAIHGFPAVPAGIKRAAVEIASILNGDSFMSTNQIADVDGAIEASPAARAILMGLKQTYLHPMAVSL